MFKSIKLRASSRLHLLAAILFLHSVRLARHACEDGNLFPTDKIHLGLDLQGGMHLVLEVETDKAVESSVERMANDLKENLMDKKVRFRNIEAKGGTISIEFASRASRDAFDKTLNDQYPDLEITSSEMVDGRDRLPDDQGQAAVEIKKTVWSRAWRRSGTGSISSASPNRRSSPRG